MKLLVDTHILLWWLADDPALPRWAATAIADPDNDVLVSAASVWEISIKQAIGRLDAPDDLLDRAGRRLRHAVDDRRARTWPPGDSRPTIPIRSTGCSSLRPGSEGLTLVSVDRRFGDYDVALLAAG